jgi:hypothetical protein
MVRGRSDHGQARADEIDQGILEEATGGLLVGIGQPPVLFVMASLFYCW